MSGPDRDPPSDPAAQPTDRVSNVVPISAAARRSGPAKLAALPDATGVASMSDAPMLLANLRESCLTDATIDAARLFTAYCTKWRTWDLGSSARPQAGIVIPFFEPGATEPYAYRLKPQYPLPTRKAGKLKKYTQSRDGGSMVYTPPLPATVDRAHDISTTLYFVEGEKKALLLAQLGHCVVGLTGVDMFHDVPAKERGEGLRLHPHIASRYDIAGRACVIVFDADARAPEKPQIMLAAQKLAGVLRATGAAQVHLCLPPDAATKGIDDYALKYGLDACAQLLATVRDAVEPIEPDLGCLPLKHFQPFHGCGVEHLRMPAGYTVERNGSVWTEDASRPDEPPGLVVDAPIVVARELETLKTGELRLEYRFRDKRGLWQKVVAPRKLETRALVAALRDRGALVSATSAVQRYLDAFETANPHMELFHCAPAYGWHNDQFVLGRPIMRPGDTGVPVYLDESMPALKRLAQVIAPKRGADVNAHIAALQTAVSASPECAIAVFAALAAPLLYLLGQANFAVHLCGDSSRGKTSMLRIAASVFGDPYSPEWLASWNGTGVGIERRASMLNDLPQLYDELGAGNFEDTQRNVYMLINGEGRTRGTRDAEMRDTTSWRTVVISTGERELVTELDATGAQIRVVGVDVLGFGGMGAREVDATVTACAEHYGAFGRWWLESLVALSDDERRDMRAQYARYLSELRAVAAEYGDRLAQRSAGFFAVMQVVEACAHQAAGLGRAHGATVRDAFVARCAEPEQRIATADVSLVSILRDWVLQEGEAGFPTGVDKRDWPSRKVCGYRLDNGDIGFIPTALTDYLRARTPAVYLTRALKSELERKGVLRTELSRTSYTTRVTVGRVRIGLVRMNLAPNSDQRPDVTSSLTEETAYNNEGLR